MKLKSSWSGLLLCLSLISANSKADAPTKESLLEGCPVPEKREFPLDPKISPCDDLYLHACTPVINSFKMPEDRSYWTFSFTDANERILYARKKFLKELSNYTPSDDHGAEIKAYYLGCMNEKASAQEERDFVKTEKQKVMSLKNREQLAELSAGRIASPDESFTGYSLEANQDEPNQWSVNLSAGLMTYPEKSFYKKPEALKALEKLAFEFFKAAKVDRAKQRAHWVVEFEKNLAADYVTMDELRERESQRNALTRAELLRNYPALKYDGVLRLIPEKTELRVMVPESLRFMNSAFQKAPLETLKSVYLFHDLRKHMDDAYPAFYKQVFEFARTQLGGPDKRPPRDERCANEVTGNFPMEIDSEMIPILFKGFSEDKVKTLVTKIRAALEKNVADNTWLSDASRRGALKKLKNAKMYLVKPQNDAQWDFNPLTQYATDRHLGNERKLRKLQIEKEFAELKKDRNREKWWINPLNANAYYSSEDNKFTLLQGILQYPFFDANLKEEQNFGGIGMVVGHELGHGVDDQGSKYDDEGRLKAWMTEADLVEFKKRGGAFVEQFNAIGHNGKLTLGENIGDHVGLFAAYEAAFPKDKGSQADKQSFFIEYARLWCQVVRPKLRETLLKVNPHAMGEARTNEQVRHHPGFYEAFGCKAGDKMYVAPEKRIKVW